MPELHAMESEKDRTFPMDIISKPSCILITGAAMAATVANQPTTAPVTIPSIILRLVEILRRYRHPQGSAEMKLYWLSLEIHAGFIHHRTLQTLIREPIGLSILDENRPCFNEGKCHIVAHTFCP